MSFVELHCHSAYSFADGASLPEELAAEAERLGYRALALTDHNGLYGAMEFAQQMRGRELQPITGAEVTLQDGSHLTLLAETPTGYAHLCRLLTTAHMENERGKPVLDRRALKDRAEGLILLSGCRESEVGRALERRDPTAARRALSDYREWFGRENCFVELQHNRVHGDTPRGRALVRLARELELGVVATNNVHYHVRERHRLQDALVSVKHRTSLDQSHHVRRANSEFHLKAFPEMEHRYRSLPEALSNTLRIAERCSQFNLTRDLGYVFPDFQQEGNGPAEPADAALERICREALAHRYAHETDAVRAEARRRVDEELDLVRYHKLAGFFLVHRDILEIARAVAARLRKGRARGRFDLPPGRGRGSSVSSILCYLIGLSPVDPVRARLTLGRFLNKELASVPDIDLDFPRDIREDLIRAVHQRYGEDHAAMVATFPTYRIRSAIRDLGLALGLPAPDVDRLAKLSEGAGPDAIETELQRIPGFERAMESKSWQLLVELARDLKGFPQHLSQHVGGMIISSRPLIELVPVERSRMDGRLICQWDKDSCDDARFIKIDFLSLGTLSAVEECLDLIAENRKPPVDLSRIDFEDAAVYDRICAGETVGVFQIESRAQIQMLTRTQPRNLDDLTVEVAIVRPGPIVGGAVNPYVRCRERMRKNPRARPSYEHRLLIPVLEDTLGVILYQDQVLGVCQALAGFSVGRAEALRRAMSRRRSLEAMEQFRVEFIAGARARGVHPRISRRIFDKLLGFSNYGFPKAHAASFAVLAYQTSWLCHYFPAEYVTGILNQLPMGFYSRDVLLNEFSRMGVTFERPDVNESQVECTVSGETVRLGLRFIDGVGRRVAEQIRTERAVRGPFPSLTQFLRRVAIPCGAVERLVLAGAFDGLGLERRALLWSLGLIARTQGWMNRSAPGAGSLVTRRQQSLYPDLAQDQAPLPALTAWERMLHDYRLMELSPDTHPMALLRAAFPKGLARTSQLRQMQDERRVQVAGLVVTRQRPSTAKGFLFLLVEDEFGMVNVVVAPPTYERCRTAIRGEPLILIRGTVQHRHGNLNLICEDALSLLDALREPGPDGDVDHRTAELLNELRTAAPAAHQWH